jgi:23S rRNA (guanosine2251-2'-O)-methyltransferase
MNPSQASGPIEYICGLHAVGAALRHDPQHLQVIRVDTKRHDQRIQALLDEAQRLGVRVQTSPRHELDRLSGDTRHQGVVAEYSGATAAHDENDLEDLLQNVRGPALVLVLDGVQDPHNLGACLRTADAAGVHAVIIPADRAVGLTPTVRKVASGGAESVPLIQVSNLARTLRRLQQLGLWLVGADSGAAASFYQIDFSVPAAIVMGAEGKGLRRLTREHCNHLVQIPMAGSVESLNVSVAAAVILYETVRQRRSS